MQQMEEEAPLATPPTGAGAVDAKGGGKRGWHVRLTNDKEEEFVADRILLATGVEVDVGRDPLLAPFLDGMMMTRAVVGGEGGSQGGSTSHNNSRSSSSSSGEHCFTGLPVPDLSLRLTLPQGMEVYTMGPYAALSIGKGSQIERGRDRDVCVCIHKSDDRRNPPPLLLTGPNAGNLAGGMAASRIIADEIRASKAKAAQVGYKRRQQQQEEEEEEEEDSGEEEEGGIRDIHDLNNPFSMLQQEEEEEEEEN